ncbi:hypothetical protein [Actinomadura sp. 6N118]|uniref:hypothetical protein n=1 Tax=Actinomadura sp. 6N118 TaxID=3375151 RepID=UPI003789BE5D
MRNVPALSWLVKNFMKSRAVALFLANDDRATLWPPRLEEPGPLRPGSGATVNFPHLIPRATTAPALRPHREPEDPGALPHPSAPNSQPHPAPSDDS